MVDRKVTELPVALSLIDEDTFYIIQGGLDKRGTYGFLKSEIEKETSDLTEAAQVAADSAEADAIQTAADRVQTGLDATSSASSASSANTSKNLAEQWANEDEDVVVASGEYSAKHYSLKAAADAADTAADVIQTNADVVSAAASEAKAQQWANEDEDVPVEVGLFSALHYAAKAAEDLVQTNADVVTTNNNVTTSNNILTNVETIYDNFDDRYLGTKGSDPLVDNDGDPLITGALYFNTSTGLRVYNGTAWEPSTASAINVSYNNGSSGLLSTDVQAAIDEVVAELIAKYDDSTASTGTGSLVKQTSPRLNGTPIIDGTLTVGGTTVNGDNGGLLQLTKSPNSTAITGYSMQQLGNAVWFFTNFGGGNRHFRMDFSELADGAVSDIYHDFTPSTGTGNLVKQGSPFLTTPSCTTLANTAAGNGVATAAFVKNVSLGWNQTWQDVTGSRSTGVTYTNTTGKPIYVFVRQISGDIEYKLTVDGIVTCSVFGATGISTPVFGIVPSGSTYTVTNNGKSVVLWTELR